MSPALVRSKFKAFLQILKGRGKPSFSQVGEDCILSYFFYSKGIKHPSYVDIGANQPVHGSNTYFFYHRGSTGVCIEPEPVTFRNLKAARPKDICVNVGIGIDNSVTEAPFYVFPPKYSGWNTFSAEEAEQRKSEGIPYVQVLTMPLKNINTIISETLNKAPDFISIDVEGLDLAILKTLDFKKYGPTALVVETIRFGDSSVASKQQDIIDFVLAQGYTVYADTHVNTIFVKQ